MLLKELKGRGWCRLRGGTFEGAGGYSWVAPKTLFLFHREGGGGTEGAGGICFAARRHVKEKTSRHSERKWQEVIRLRCNVKVLGKYTR